MSHIYTHENRETYEVLRPKRIYSDISEKQKQKARARMEAKGPIKAGELYRFNGRGYGLV
jgi:hypothetical protein